jgi:uncharacterized coiled-coil protein SlyX
MNEPLPNDPTLADIINVFQRRIAELEESLATRGRAIMMFSRMNIDQRKRIDQLEHEVQCLKSAASSGYKT